MYMANMSPNARRPNTTYILLTVVGVRVRGNTIFRVCVGSDILVSPRKILTLGVLPNGTPNTSGYALQWNIGLSRTRLVISKRSSLVLSRGPVDLIREVLRMGLQNRRQTENSFYQTDVGGGGEARGGGAQRVLAFEVVHLRFNDFNRSILILFHLT